MGYENVITYFSAVDDFFGLKDFNALKWLLL